MSKTGLDFSVGDHVVYPAHGVGQVQGIETQEVAGYSLEVYVITFDHEKMTLRVPTAKARTAGLRSLSAAKELLRIRLLTLPTTLLVPISCGVLWNVRGLAFGIAASVWWNVLLYWHVFWKVLHRENPPHPMEGVDPDHAT